MQSDLISKRDLIKFIDKTVVPELLLHDNDSGAGVMAGLSKALEETDVIPTIDAVPVVHARWINEEIPGRVDTCGKPDRRARCSACQFNWGEMYSVENYFKHCPNCGVKMDGGTE